MMTQQATHTLSGRLGKVVASHAFVVNWVINNFFLLFTWEKNGLNKKYLFFHGKKNL